MLRRPLSGRRYDNDPPSLDPFDSADLECYRPALQCGDHRLSARGLHGKAIRDLAMTKGRNETDEELSARIKGLEEEWRLAHDALKAIERNLRAAERKRDERERRAWQKETE